MVAITGIVLGLCFFIVPVWAYRRGLKDGLGINQGKVIEPIRPSISTAFTQARDKHEMDKITEGITNILAYDGNPQKEVKNE